MKSHADSKFTSWHNSSYWVLVLYILELTQLLPSICLQGNLWKESLDILKMAVSHSSHLDTPPPRPASSVWTAHDSSWSAEAMMIKKDLPGRTLDFTFDLSATPVIGRKGTPEIPGEVVKESKLLSPVGTVDLSTWRKPHLSQVKVISVLIYNNNNNNINFICTLH